MISVAGDLLFDMQIDPGLTPLSPPSTLLAPAGQSEEPDLATNTTEVVY